MNDKIRKYLVLNIPDLFICWIILKLGTAYRMAPGADFGHKLIGIMQTARPFRISRRALTVWIG